MGVVAPGEKKMKDKTNDGGNEIVKVCSNRTSITKEHKIVIIGNTHSRVCAKLFK